MRDAALCNGATERHLGYHSCRVHQATVSTHASGSNLAAFFRPLAISATERPWFAGAAGVFAGRAVAEARVVKNVTLTCNPRVAKL